MARSRPRGAMHSRELQGLYRHLGCLWAPGTTSAELSPGVSKTWVQPSTIDRQCCGVAVLCEGAELQWVLCNWAGWVCGCWEEHGGWCRDSQCEADGDLA